MPEGGLSLSEAQEAAALERWIDRRGGIDRGLAALLSHPRLHEAIRAFAVGTDTIPSADPTLGGRLKDVGRYMAALSALYLHQTGEVTLPRLRELAAARFYMSTGRARSLLGFLSYLGYLDEVPPAEPGGPVRYLPTTRFVAAWREHLSAVLTIAAILESTVAAVRDRLGDPAVFGTFCRHHAEAGFMEARETHQDTGFVRVFLHRFAGAQILCQLYCTDGPATSGAAPVSVNAIAHRHGVSRAHVRRLLDAGVRERLLRYDRKRTVMLSDEGRAVVRFFNATQFYVFIVAAQRTMAELGRVR